MEVILSLLAIVAFIVQIALIVAILRTASNTAKALPLLQAAVTKLRDIDSRLTSLQAIGRQYDKEIGR